MSVPAIGESYRGVEGHNGYLLRQAWHTVRGALDDAVRPHDLSSAQYAVLSVLDREREASGADLARACNTTPQAMNGVLAILERSGLISRRPHSTHGRILVVSLTDEGSRRVAEATPAVRSLESTLEKDFTPDEIHTIKRWLVAAASRTTT